MPIFFISTIRPDLIRRLIRLALPLTLFLTLCACSTLPPVNESALTPRQFHQKIDISGRLSAQYQQGKQAQAVHISFTWSQQADNTFITLGSPTGQTLATIQLDANGAQLNQSGQAPRFAVDVNQLILDALGWPLPVASLRDWLQGFISADHRTPITTEPHTLYAEGWELSYPSWQIEGDTARPRRLDLSRQTEQAGLVSLRIAIDEWKEQ